MKALNNSFCYCALLSFALLSCNKEDEDAQPTASFEGTEEVLEINESRQLVNTSVDATHYFWNIGGSEESQEKNPTISFSQAGEYNIKLSAISKNRAKTDEVTNQIQVVGYTYKFLGSQSGTITYNGQSNQGSIQIDSDAGPNRIRITSTIPDFVFLGLIDVNNPTQFSIENTLAFIGTDEFTLSGNGSIDDGGTISISAVLIGDTQSQNWEFSSN